VIRYLALAYLARHYGHSSVRFLLKHGVAIGLAGLGLAIVVAVSLRLYQRHRVKVGEPE
jgi:hypothetical protein